MKKDELQTKIDSISWYHDFDFPDGLKARANTPDAGFHRRLWHFIESNLDTIDFQGKSVLDIGCWDGYWSFYAERRGARQVLATDDVSQNWAAGEGLRLARELLGSQIVVDQRRSVYQLDSIQQTFDVVLFLGVYYHLLDPFYAFSQIRRCCGPQTVVVFEGDVGRNLFAGEARYCFFDPNKATFVPSIDTLDMMVKGAYFSIASRAYFSEYYADPKNEVITGSSLRRWWKSSSIRRKWKDSPFCAKKPAPKVERPETVVSDRSLLVCRPFEGQNDMHYYKPPFGLDTYDSRYGQPSSSASS